MSFNTNDQVLVARRAHVCTWCNEAIAPGDTYWRWVTFEDSAFVSKMHPECREACSDECNEAGEWEYLAFENERPALHAQAASIEALDDPRTPRSDQQRTGP